MIFNKSPIDKSRSNFIFLLQIIPTNTTEFQNNKVKYGGTFDTLNINTLRKHVAKCLCSRNGMLTQRYT